MQLGSVRMRVRNSTCCEADGLLAQKSCSPRYMVMFAGKHPFLLPSRSSSLVVFF